MSKPATILPPSFYQQTDVVALSKTLLGKYLVTNFDGQLCSGKIIETEAYRGPDDKACHAFNNKRTKRTEPMFATGGIAHVYLCYGIHHLFNVVTGEKDMPHAILIRALQPVDNKTLMLHRRNKQAITPQLTAGPGVLSKALGITTAHTGMLLKPGPDSIWIEDRGDIIKENEIIAGPRVGIDYAEECKDWPWRFRI